MGSLLSRESEEDNAVRTNESYLRGTFTAKISEVTPTSDRFHTWKRLDNGGRAESWRRSICGLERVPRLQAKPALLSSVLLPNSDDLKLEGQLFLVPFLHCRLLLSMRGCGSLLRN
jgi:hypothetical protein